MSDTTAADLGASPVTRATRATRALIADDQDDYVSRAPHHGACGFLLKDAAPRCSSKRYGPHAAATR